MPKLIVNTGVIPSNLREFAKTVYFNLKDLHANHKIKLTLEQSGHLDQLVRFLLMMRDDLLCRFEAGRLESTMSILVDDYFSFVNRYARRKKYVRYPLIPKKPVAKQGFYVFCELDRVLAAKALIDANATEAGVFNTICGGFNQFLEGLQLYAIESPQECGELANVIFKLTGDAPRSPLTMLDSKRVVPPDPVVARVGGTLISHCELYQNFRQSYPGVGLSSYIDQLGDQLPRRQLGELSRPENTVVRLQMLRLVFVRNTELANSASKLLGDSTFQELLDIAIDQRRVDRVIYVRNMQVLGEILQDVLCQLDPDNVRLPVNELLVYYHEKCVLAQEHEPDRRAFDHINLSSQERSELVQTLPTAELERRLLLQENIFWNKGSKQEHSRLAALQCMSNILREHRDTIKRLVGPDARLKFRGSLVRGLKGYPKSGIAPTDQYDCDAFIEVSNAFWQRLKKAHVTVSVEGHSKCRKLKPLRDYEPLDDLTIGGDSRAPIALTTHQSAEQEQIRAIFMGLQEIEVAVKEAIKLAMISGELLGYSLCEDGKPDFDLYIRPVASVEQLYREGNPYRPGMIARRGYPNLEQALDLQSVSEFAKGNRGAFKRDVLVGTDERLDAKALREYQIVIGKHTWYIEDRPLFELYKLKRSMREQTGQTLFSRRFLPCYNDPLPPLQRPYRRQLDPMPGAEKYTQQEVFNALFLTMYMSSMYQGERSAVRSRMVDIFLGQFSDHGFDDEDATRSVVKDDQAHEQDCKPEASSVC